MCAKASVSGFSPAVAAAPALTSERPAALMLSVLVATCFSLTACGGSGRDSSTPTASAAVDQAEFSDGSSTGSGDVFAGLSPVQSAAISSAHGEDHESGEAGSAGGSGMVMTKAVAAPTTAVTTAATTLAAAAPTMTKAPTIGAAPFAMGATLTRTIGTYPGSTAIAGRRYRNNVLIPGATSASYTLVAADAGQVLVYEELAQRNDTKVQKWFRSASVTVAGSEPTMTKAPTFGVGPFSQGMVFTRAIGEYPGSTPIAGRRYRNNVLIDGATGADYTIVAADVGQPLVYEELVERNDTKVQKWFRSAPVTVVNLDPVMTKAPAIGVAPFNPGATLTRAIGEYPGSTPIAGRRYRNNVLIAGATAATYTITAADAGQELVYEELAERDDTKVQKWFRSAAVKVGTVIPPGDPVQPPLGQINSVDTIVSDMKLLNDFVLKGYENEKYGWYVGPGETHMGNNSSFTNVPEWSSFLNNPAYAGVSAKAMLPWLVIFDGVSDAASNTAVEIRNMRTYLKSRATGKWIALGGPVKASGTYYGKPNTGLPAYDEQTAGSYDTGSMIKVPENNGYFWHGWWSAGRMAVDPADIGAIFVTVQARLAVADPGRADDRAQAQLGLQVGADYYVDTSTVYQEIAPAIGIARTKKITSNWQAFSYTTFSDVGSQIPGGGLTEAQFRAAPPPME